MSSCVGAQLFREEVKRMAGSMIMAMAYIGLGMAILGGIITLVGCFRLNEWLLIIGNSFCAVGMLILIFAQLQVI